MMSTINAISNEYSTIYYMTQFSADDIDAVILSYTNNPDWNLIESRIPNTPNTVSCTKVDDKWIYDNSNHNNMIFNAISLLHRHDNNRYELLSYELFSSSQDINLATSWIVSISLMWRSTMEVITDAIMIDIMPIYAKHDVATNYDSAELSVVHDNLTRNGATLAIDARDAMNEYINAGQNASLIDYGLSSVNPIQESLEVVSLDSTGISIPLGLIKLDVLEVE